VESLYSDLQINIKVGFFTRWYEYQIDGWVYIDGSSHYYDFVRKDLELTLQESAPGVVAAVVSFWKQKRSGRGSVRSYNA
jgi:hypothetical protein